MVNVYPNSLWMGIETLTSLFKLHGEMHSKVTIGALFTFTFQ